MSGKKPEDNHFLSIRGIALVMMAMLYLTLTACNDLAVFIQRPRGTSFKGVESVQVNNEGRFELSWSLPLQKSGSKDQVFDIFMLRSSESISLVDDLEEKRINEVTIDFSAQLRGVDAPSSKGERIGTVTNVRSFTLNETIDPSKHYLFQVVERRQEKNKSSKQRVILAEAKFQDIESVRADAKSGGLLFTWADVPGASDYEIYADRGGIKRIGASDSPQFLLYDLTSNQDLCIRPRRGAFAALNCFPVEGMANNARIIAVNTLEGQFTQGAVLDFQVVFSESVDISEAIKLPLGENSRFADCSPSSSTKVLHCTYTITGTDNFESLELGPFAYGSIKDASGKNVPSFIPTAFASPQVVADTLAPTAPSSVGYSSAAGSTVAVGFSPSSDLHFKQHRIKLCQVDDCATSCLGETSSQNSPVQFASIPSGNYYACVRGEDLVGNKSPWVSSVSTFSNDSTPPTVLRVSALTPNGAYKVGETVLISVLFSENVYASTTAAIGLKLETGAADRTATYQSGSGSNALVFSYSIQASDTASDLDYFSTTALTAVGAATIEDASGNSATLTLPALPGSDSLAGQNNIVIDTTIPTVPSAVMVPVGPLNTSSLSVSWVSSSDTNLVTHNIKLCSNNNCSTGCLAESSSLSSPKTMTAPNGSTLYACVQGADSAGNTSAWIPSSTAVSIDTTVPTVTNVASLTPSGSYKVGQALNFRVRFSEIVNAANTSDLSLTLDMLGTDRQATFVAGSGSTDLTFTYTIQSGDTTDLLDYAGNAALSTGVAGTIRDAALNNATLTLSNAGSATSISGQASIIVDTTLPSAATSVGFAGPSSTSVNFNVSFGNSSDSHFKQHNVKVCTVGGCSASCDPTVTGAASPITVSGTNGLSYYACVQGEDDSGNLSAWSESALKILVDTSIPTIDSVSSTTADGSYRAGQSVILSVHFTENVVVTNPNVIGLLLSTNQTATYLSGSGSSTLLFTYVIQPSDSSNDLDFFDSNSLTLGSGTAIRDAAGNGATLTLPATAGPASIAGQKALIIDTTAPSAPSAISFGVSTINTTSFPMTWTAGTDSHMRYSSLKLCTNNNCSTGCTGLDTATTSPHTMNGIGGETYYGCAQSEDLAGNTSAWVPSTGTLFVDSSDPTILSVTTTTVDGIYHEGQSLSIQINFSENVTVTNGNGVTLKLGLGNMGTDVVYSTGSGSSTLNFAYTLQSGDFSPDLNYVSSASLVLAGGSFIRDASANNANLTLPALNNASSLGGSKNIIIDTASPTAPSAVGFVSATSSSLSFSMSWTNSTDTNFRYHNAKICSSNNCATGCISDSTSVASPLTMTGLNAGIYYGCVQGEDLAGHTTAWVPSASTVTIDTTPPTVTNVTSTLADGFYKQGQVVPITILFSENVFVTNPTNLGLTLGTGSTQQVATYVSGSGSNSLLFNYTVQSGDTASDLDYASSTALSTGVSGTIRDASSNNATLTLANPGDAASIGGQKALVIDTTLPANPASVGFASTNVQGTFNLSWGNSTDSNFRYHSAKICTQNDCSTGCVSAANPVASPLSVTGSHGITYYGCVRGEDLAGNLSSWVPSTTTTTVDTVLPTVTNVTSTTADGYYAAGQILSIKVQFNEIINVTNTAQLGLTLATGTAPQHMATYTSGTGTSALVFSYTVVAGDIASDLDYASTGALAFSTSGTIRDAALNDAVLTLPALGGGSSIAGQKAIVLDTVSPVAPSTLAFASTPTSTTTASMSFSLATDTNFSTHNVKLCTAANCTGCTTATTSSTSPAALTGVNQTTYYGCAQGQDLAGNVSAWVASASTVKIGPTFTGVSSGQFLGSWDDGTGKLELTFLASPAGVAAYKVYYSPTAAIGTFNFTTALATITAGDATYDSVSTDTKLLVSVPLASVQDGYYVVRAYDATNSIIDSNTAVSSVVYVLNGQAGYVLVPRKFSLLAYDYYIMKYEASLVSGSRGSNSTKFTDAEKQSCNYQLHANNNNSSTDCGSKGSSMTVASVAGAVPLTSMTYSESFFTCRNMTNSGSLVRLPTVEEWRRAAQWSSSDYQSMWTTFSNGSGSNCKVSGTSAENTGSRAACKSPLGVYDMAGNVSEWVDNRMLLTTVPVGERRFGVAPPIQRVFANGIDNVVRRLQLQDSTSVYGNSSIVMGANYVAQTITSQKVYGNEVMQLKDTATSIATLGFRCIGFNKNALPTMDELALPSEPTFTASDYSGAANTWTIPENRYVGEAKPEVVKIVVNGDPNDCVAEGNVEITWNPWSKTACNPSCTTWTTGLTYQIFRFIEPNRLSTRMAQPWALAGTGSAYTSDKPLDPLAVDASGNRIYSANTPDGKIVATITNCDATTPANCTFTDSTGAGTGFSTQKVYNYILTVKDATGNTVTPIIQRFRSPYFTGPNVLGDQPFFRFEQRLRRAAVFLVDEAYQEAQNPAQVMVHVPMDKSGLDHDFFMQKYEASGSRASGNEDDGNANWPFTSSNGAWDSTPAVCEDTFQRTGAFGDTCLSSMGAQANSTWSFESRKYQGPVYWNTQAPYFKGCRNSSFADGAGIAYNLHIATDPEWFKAADWGDVNQDGTIDQNPFIGNLVLNDLENPATDDNSTVRCHVDNNPGSIYNTGSSQTANCRSRYGAADMVGNAQEVTSGQIYDGVGLDNGVDGLYYGVGFPTSSATSGYTISPFRGIVGGAGLATFYLSGDAYRYNNGGIKASVRGGKFDDWSQAGRNALDFSLHPGYADIRWGTRCGY